MSKATWFATTAGLALTAALGSTVAQAQHWRGAYAAPSPYVQQVPVPQPGSVWVPGHWQFNGYRHVWMNGYYQVQQPVYGQRYGHGRRHDLDRDGIPDRYDRDRDGDGVPNRYDSRPDNPWRR